MKSDNKKYIEEYTENIKSLNQCLELSFKDCKSELMKYVNEQIKKYDEIEDKAVGYWVDELNKIDEQIYNGNSWISFPTWVSERTENKWAIYNSIPIDDDSDELKEKFFNNFIDDYKNDVKKFLNDNKLNELIFYDSQNNFYFTYDEIKHTIKKQAYKRDYEIDLKQYWEWVKEIVEKIIVIKNFDVASTTNSIYINDGTIRISDHLPPDTCYQYIEGEDDESKMNLVYLRTTTKELENFYNDYIEMIEKIKEYWQKEIKLLKNNIKIN